MAILTEQQIQLLLENGVKQRINDKNGKIEDLYPQAFLYLPGTSAQWLLVSLSPDDPDLAFGLLNIEGVPELGYVRLSELEVLRGYMDKGVSQDPMLEEASIRGILQYAKDAKLQGQIFLQFDEKVETL